MFRINYFRVLPLFLTLSVAKSDVNFKTMCANDYRDMNNNKINVEDYCSNNLCIEKCCGTGEMLNLKHSCMNSQKFIDQFKNNIMKNKLRAQVNSFNIIISTWDGRDIKKSTKNFVFIQNHRNVSTCTSEQTITNDYYILEDGSIRMQDTEASKIWFDINRLQYCIEFKFTNHTGKPMLKAIVREYNADPEDDEKKSVFVLVGLLISSFFLLLVLVVYCLLPKLQNLIGMVLMAYVLSILSAFIMRVIIHLKISSMHSGHCKVLAPILYFAAVSSLFWLNVMSFDVWWTLRGHRKRYAINRRGELVKFLWYCLYAWGTPLLITAIVVTLDNINLSNLPHVTKPPFDDCFANEDGVRYYFMIPIGVIIGVNIVLFGITVYNIWMIKRALQNSQESRCSKQQTSRFNTYIKLSVIMGVSWCLELIPSEMPFWMFILTTTYNLFIGVAIFFLFVFEKRILFMLCKRLNIRNEFVKKLELSQRNRSGTTRTTRALTYKSRSRDEQELHSLRRYPKEKTSDV